MFSVPIPVIVETPAANVTDRLSAKLTVAATSYTGDGSSLTGVGTANVRTGILDVAGIATFRSDTLVGS